MVNKSKRVFLLITRYRGLFEDIFLYAILLCVIGFSSWFLYNTQTEFEKNLPKKTTDNNHIYLEALDKEIAPSATPEKDSVVSRFDKNYLAYLQSQANLNKNRYDLGSQILIANTTRKNIGFLIGTLLCLIGCIVIVRRIRNMSIEAEGNAAGQQFKFLTASPGVLLTLFGSAIILATIIRVDKVEVTDYDPLLPYVQRVANPNPSATPPEEGLTDIEKDILKKIEEEKKKKEGKNEKPNI